MSCSAAQRNSGLVFIVFGLWNNPSHRRRKGEGKARVYGVYQYPSSLSLPAPLPHRRLFFFLSTLAGNLAREASIFPPIWITRTSRILRYKFHLLNAKFTRFARDLDHRPVRSTEKFQRFIGLITNFGNLITYSFINALMWNGFNTNCKKLVDSLLAF